MQSFDADRTLASIVKINNIIQIPKANNVMLAEINGWQCVIPKDQFHIGDLAIYFAIDSVPDLTDPNLQFLVKKNVNRIKTMKCVGIISQGLLGPLKWLEDRHFDVSKCREGDDVTIQMGVKKYVSNDEIEQYDIKPNKFPSNIPKTDEDRIQNNINMITKLLNRNIIITEKADGCSCTFVYDNGVFNICSRNFICQENDEKSIHSILATKLDIHQKMISYNKNIAIQGEIVGPKVNCNRMQLDDQTFKVFNIFDIDNRTYLLYDDVNNICTQLELDQVKLIYNGNFNKLKISEIIDTKIILNGLINMSNSLEYKQGCPAEGMVIKSNDNDDRISFKILSNVYLLKHDK
jgi:RNA ligase (TIGR02306 family)